jgi:hypothetical protein
MPSNRKQNKAVSHLVTVELLAERVSFDASAYRDILKVLQCF